MKQGDPAMRIRLPPSLKLWVEKEAERLRRSKSAQVVACIESAMLRAGTLSQLDPDGGTPTA